MNTKDKIKNLKDFEDILDFSNLDENHELFRHKNDKVFSNFIIETPKKIWIDGFVCLRSKM